MAVCLLRTKTMTDAVCVANPVFLSTAFFVCFTTIELQMLFQGLAVVGTVSKDAC